MALTSSSVGFSYEYEQLAAQTAFRGYSTKNLLQWGNACAQQMVRHFLMSTGYDPQTAWAISFEACSCIIDGFRETMTYDEAMALSSEVRKLKSSQYAALCYTTNTGEPL